MASSPCHLLHHIFRRASPQATSISPISILLKTSAVITATPIFSVHYQPLLGASSAHSLSLLPNPPLFASLSTSVSSHPHQDFVSDLPNSLAEILSANENEILFDEEIEDDDNDEIEAAQQQKLEGMETCSIQTATRVSFPERSMPNLTVKEKKELASYAHSLGDKLKSQQVGKSGVTDNVVIALIETLEANELLKLKIHQTCPGELDDIVRQLEHATGSVVVGQIGRTVIFYRPSLAKLKAEEKKNKAGIVSTRKGWTSKLPITAKKMQRGGQVLRKSRKGRRGSSRLSSI
ncbi:hypothetical protein Nepgr_004625 [Nepenthes gracilis]|uniref:CRM domain-containing protein n=1 Tax=Nepenthes gracilis TaxID=150966 RepID=A0AAD3S1R2_NEPGR|nr:hypothetical protein Nepgr_004625 [Nepenthes gracilis]